MDWIGYVEFQLIFTTINGITRHKLIKAAKIKVHGKAEVYEVLLFGF